MSQSIEGCNIDIANARHGDETCMAGIKALGNFRRRSNIQGDAALRRDASRLVALPMSSLAGLGKENRSAKVLPHHN